MYKCISVLLSKFGLDLPVPVPTDTHGSNLGDITLPSLFFPGPRPKIVSCKGVKKGERCFLCFHALWQVDLDSSWTWCVHGQDWDVVGGLWWVLSV